MLPVTNKANIRLEYEAILRRGSLSQEQVDAVLDGRPVPGVILQQSGGSSGGAPLRIPRTPAEMHWLGGKLIQFHTEIHRALPQRAAFVGGISHLEAGQRLEPRASIPMRSFTHHQCSDLKSFDPDFLSMYPSVARLLLADAELGLESTQTVKLGGEPVLRTDLARLFERFPRALVLEQFGSTEMPGLAFRSRHGSQDSGYRLSEDRYDFRFEPTEGWQPLVVRDRFPERAFPIEGWFETEDEVLVRDGRILDVRRSGERLGDLRAAIDPWLARGCVQIQLLLNERTVLYEAPPAVVLPSEVSLAGVAYVTRREAVYRWVESHKMPFVLDLATVPAGALYR